MEHNEKSNLLKQLRIAKGFTQEEIAKKLHTSRTAYNKWENERTGLPLESFKKLIKVLELSEKEVINLLDYEGSNQGEKDIINTYEKVISFFKAALLFSFNHFYYDNIMISDVEYLPFENLSKEQKENVAIECGKNITKEIYDDYCLRDREVTLDEAFYNSFCICLREHPLAVILLHFGLLGNEYQEYFQRWSSQDRSMEFANYNNEREGFMLRYEREYNSKISLNLNEELKNEMDNFNKIINSKKLKFKIDTFANSIIHGDIDGEPSEEDPF
jgi:transcriptional regulator with XRE-family HTH domain